MQGKRLECELGQAPTDAYIEEMTKEAPGPINFTMFLTLIGEKMSGTDPEEEIIRAFEAFDEDGSGTLQAATFREYMTTMGDRFSEEEVCNIHHQKARRYWRYLVNSILANCVIQSICSSNAFRFRLLTTLSRWM